ncbi:hypothetical protein [Yoonia sp.]|uniref:hypothetical protein n=1 Tax=Yoonia sp. TaxID=2212373 RepID=UPI002E054796|nr:hypothetical protein [Yoonia sp.]
MSALPDAPKKKRGRAKSKGRINVMELAIVVTPPVEEGGLWVARFDHRSLPICAKAETRIEAMKALHQFRKDHWKPVRAQA